MSYNNFIIITILQKGPDRDKVLGEQRELEKLKGLKR